MALILEREIDETGAAASYWRIVRVGFDIQRKQIQVMVEGWKNKTYRQDPTKAVIKEVYFEIQFADLQADAPGELSLNNVLKLIYKNIKADAYFTGSTDDI